MSAHAPSSKRNHARTFVFVTDILFVVALLEVVRRGTWADAWIFIPIAIALIAVQRWMSSTLAAKKRSS